MKRLLFWSVITVTLAAALLAAAPDVGVAVSGAVEVPIEVQHVPGAEIAMANGATLVLNRGYGVASLTTNALVSPDTRFEIGSITKQFTAAAILQLKEQGKLKLSDPLGKFVPEYPAGKNVTLEQMLWHVSGIPDYIFVRGYPAYWHIATKTPGGFAAALSLIKDAPLDFTPGTQYEYSNSNYLLLGEVVARISGMSWQDYVRKEIFARAGMKQSAFIEDEPALLKMSTGYRMNGESELVASPWANRWDDGGGAIVSTASDVVKWDEAFFTGRIINARDVRLATTAHVLPSGESTGEGFGWWIDSFGGERRYAYTGRTWGFTAMNQYFPRLGESVAVLTNDANEQVWAIANAAVGAVHPNILQAYLRPAEGEDAAITSLVRQWVHRLKTGNLDASQLAPQLPLEELTEDEQAIRRCGDLTAAVYRKKDTRQAGTAYRYLLQFTGGVLTMSVTIDRAGKIADISLLLSDGRG